GDIGDIEDVPLIAKGMEGEEIGNSAIEDAVDGIAERAADDEADACGSHPGGRPRQPKQQKTGRNKRKSNERPAAEIAALCQQAVAYPLIPNQDEIEIGC